MRRAGLAALLLLALLLPGCLGSGGGGGSGTTTTTATGTSTATGSSTTTTTAPPPAPQVLDLLLAFEFSGCHGVTVRSSRPLDDIDAILPEGFRAAPPPGTAAGAGVLAVDLLQCGQLTTGTGIVVPDPFFGIVYTYIQRPSDRVPGAPDAPVQEYAFRLLANDTSVLQTVWPAAGYDTYAGNTTVDTVEGAEPVRVGFASVGAYNVVATGADLAALTGVRDQGFARYTALDDGSVLLWTGTYEMRAAATGPATLQVPTDDPFAVYATPQRPVLSGVADQVDDGAVHVQDLRRIFPRA